MTNLLRQGLKNDGAWKELQESKEQREVWGLKKVSRLEVQRVLVWLMELFVLKLAFLVYSEVDDSEWRIAVRISVRQVRHECPISSIWRSLLLVVPCLEAFVPG